MALRALRALIQRKAILSSAAARPLFFPAPAFESRGRGEILGSVARRDFRRVRYRVLKAGKDNPEELETEEDLTPAETIDLTLVEKRYAERVWREILALTIPNIGPVVKLVVEEDKKRSGLAGILYIVAKLRSHRRSKQALSIVDWITDEKPFGEIDESMYKLHISLAFEVNSVRKAEKIFDSMPKELQQDDAVLAAMAAGYASTHRREQAEQILLQFKLPDMEPYTALVKLYFRTARYDKAESLYKQMKASKKLEPDLAMYSAMLRERSSMENSAEELKTDAEAALRRAGAYDDDPAIEFTLARHAMALFGYLGQADQVRKIWRHIKQQTEASSSSIPANCYLDAIEAFGAAGRVRSAEKVAGEMEMAKAKLVEISAAMIRVYVRNEMADKAEAVIDDLRCSGVWNLFRPHAELVTGYLEIGQPDRAMRALKAALLVKVMKPTYGVMLRMLPVFEMLGDAEGAEDMVMRYRGFADVRMFKGLLRVYVSAKVKPPEEIEARLTVRRFVLDEETLELLKKLKQVVG